MLEWIIWYKDPCIYGVDSPSYDAYTATFWRNITHQKLNLSVKLNCLLFTNSLSLKELEQKTIIPISIPMVKCHFFTESTDHVHMHLLQFMALRSTQFGGHPSTSWSINFHLESKIKIKQQNQHQKYTWIIGNLTFIIIIKRSILIIINIYRLHSRIVILQRFQPCKSCLKQHIFVDYSY